VVNVLNHLMKENPVLFQLLQVKVIVLVLIIHANVMETLEVLERVSVQQYLEKKNQLSIHIPHV